MSKYFTLSDFCEILKTHKTDKKHESLLTILLNMKCEDFIIIINGLISTNTTQFFQCKIKHISTFSPS